MAPHRRVRVMLGERTPSDAVHFLYDEELGGVRVTVSSEAGVGYTIDHGHYGRFFVDSDGSGVLCAPRRLPAWRWQRLLVGQVLPLASLLRGLEPLHASAVHRDTRALLMLAPSGAGKTSVSLWLRESGWTLLADDVVAAEVASAHVLAHSGTLVSTMAEREHRGLSRAGLLDGWSELGSEDGELRMLAPRAHAVSAPIRAVYLLDRTGGGDLAIADLPEDLTRVLLGATFNTYVRDAERVERQLDLCAALSAGVPVRRVSVPPDAEARATAREIARDAAALA